ncbi:MAG: monovalent cation/H(+) antiporter subunit G [Opitutales bacterium]
MNGLMETLDFAFLAEAVPAAEAGLSALDVVGMILATIGLVFFLGAAVGLYRFPDFYTRMHAAGKGDTLSSLLILAGFALITLEDFSAAGGLLVVKVLAIVLFIMLTSPTSTHALMRAGFEDGVEPVVKPAAKKKKKEAGK